MAKKEEYKEKNLQFMSEMAGQDGVSELPCGVLYKEIEKGYRYSFAGIEQCSFRPLPRDAD